MRTICLRQSLLVVLAVLIGWANTMAQSGPLVPKSEEARTTNSVYLYKVFGKEVNIPVYLTSNRTVSIKYCWYSTKMVFGESVRISENPYRIEEGTYTNGRLTTYAKDGYIYTLEWYPDGKIKRIRKYDQTTGNEREAVRHYVGDKMVIGLWLNEGERVNCPGKGLTDAKYVYMPSGTLETNYSYSSDYKELAGFRISSQYLCRIVKAKRLWRNNGAFVKQWQDRSSDEKLVRIMDNGSFYTENVYDASDKVRCAKFLN